MSANFQKLKDSIITYRNAIYQGYIDQVSQCRSKFGLIYLAKSHEFIGCKNWQNDQLSGQTFFFNSDRNYSYGNWYNNRPHGFNVFKIQDILIFLQFRNGKILKNTKIILVYENINYGIIITAKNQTYFQQVLQFEINQKKQLFESQDLYKLFKICRWPQSYFIDGQTLIRFISNKIISGNNQKQKISSFQQNNPVKLRLLSNKYYRFGFDQGLAIIFDQQYKRISVGIHNKANLNSIGANYVHTDEGTSIRQGLFSKQNKLFNFPSKQLNFGQQRQLNKVYNQNLLTSVNFCNKFYTNLVKKYQQFIKIILKNQKLQNQINNYIKRNKSYDDQIFQFSKIDLRQGQSHTQEYLLTHENYNEKKQAYPHNKIISKNQILNDRLRLETIKKQIYNSIQRRNRIYQKQSHDMNNSRFIINHDYVGQKEQNNRFIADKATFKLLQTPERFQKSRSRKKIFQQSQKNKKYLQDFTPVKQQKNLTPFKAKMKNRIFSKNQKEQISNFNNQMNQFIKQHKKQSRFYSNQKNKNQLQNQKQKKQQLSRLSYNLQNNKKQIKLSQQSFQQEKEGSYHKKNQKQQKFNQDSVNKKILQIKDRIYVPINTPQEIGKKKNNYILSQNQINNQSQNKNADDFKDNINTYKMIHSQSKKNLQKNNQNYNGKNSDFKSIHRNSNQVYLSKQNNSPLQYSNRKTNQNIYRMNDIPLMIVQKNQNNNSYTKKYKNKKQIQKQIQRSPDRHRCYGKNNPYLQTHNSNSKQYSYHKKNIRPSRNYQSPAKSYYNQTLSFAKQKKQKFF